MNFKKMAEKYLVSKLEEHMKKNNSTLTVEQINKARNKTMQR
jgi:hypothetical protein